MLVNEHVYKMGWVHMSIYHIWEFYSRGLVDASSQRIHDVHVDLQLAVGVRGRHVFGILILVGGLNPSEK